MSQSHKLTTDPAEGSVASLTRRQTRIRSRDDDGEEKQSAQSSTHVSPAMRMYRHALESIFATLELTDLSRVLAVSRSWAAAVRSMKTIGATVEKPLLLPSVLCSSSLARHVSKLLWYTPDSPLECSGADMQLIHSRLPNLTFIACQVVLPSPFPLAFCAKLTTVQIGFTCAKSPVASINTTLRLISGLPSLTTLWLDLPRFYPTISFAPLQALRLLLELRVMVVPGVESQLSHVQLDQLRAQPWLRAMWVDNISELNLKHLLRSPHVLQWQEIPLVREVDEAMSAALSSVPGLTTLYAHCCRHVGFCSSLVHLRSLDLITHHSVPSDAVVHALSNCPQLEELGLCALVTSANLAVLLPRLPFLRDLCLSTCGQLEFLVCFSECASLRATLTALSLIHCDHPQLHVTEMRHLYALKALTSLTINRSFAEPLDALSRSLHTPPSLMPSLTHFQYTPPEIQLDDDMDAFMAEQAVLKNALA